MSRTMWRRAVRFGRLTVVSLSLASCGTHAGLTSDGRSAMGVLTGRVTAGPTCPVERIGHPCPPTPVVAEIQARASGKVVGSTRSRSDGTYRLLLPGGTYSVAAVTENALPRCTARTVTVTTAHTVHGDISCDTGIR